MKDLARAARALGTRSIVDRTVLEGGQDWETELRQKIMEADVCQLYWSPRANDSPHVRREVQLALELGRDSFIRGLYCGNEEAPVPNELSHVHFARYRPPKDD